MPFFQIIQTRDHIHKAPNEIFLQSEIWEILDHLSVNMQFLKVHSAESSFYIIELSEQYCLVKKPLSDLILQILKESGSKLLFNKTLLIVSVVSSST